LRYWPIASLYVLLSSRTPLLEKTPNITNADAKIVASEGRTSAAPARFGRDPTMKITGGLLLLIAASLAGCIHATGPCYGVGCHAFTTPSGGQSHRAQSQGAHVQSAPEQANQASQAAAGKPNAPAAQKSHGMLALLKKIKL